MVDSAQRPLCSPQEVRKGTASAEEEQKNNATDNEHLQDVCKPMQPESAAGGAWRC